MIWDVIFTVAVFGALGLVIRWDGRRHRRDVAAIRRLESFANHPSNRGER